jgi:hypothetical protein
MKRKVAMPVKSMPMKPNPMPSHAQALQQRLNAAMKTPASQRGSKLKRT